MRYIVNNKIVTEKFSIIYLAIMLNSWCQKKTDYIINKNAMDN